MKVAWFICERAWLGRGVRAYRWPCGTLVVVPVQSKTDANLQRRCGEQLFATYARDARGRGPQMLDVMRDLTEARP